ncbi:MAG TPA: helix-hairpin-helix domain-containing protein, partial [Anaerolineales bacterium]
QAGLYELPPGSRVNDAIQAAGGFSDEADPNALNLAEMLQDGQQIEVPDLSPTPSSDSVTRSASPASGLVDINSATLEQLDSLPAIGPKTAQDIIDYRNRNGLFARIEDILDVAGIGQVTFEKIKNLISVETSP